MAMSEAKDFDGEVRSDELGFDFQRVISRIYLKLSGGGGVSKDGCVKRCGGSVKKVKKKVKRGKGKKKSKSSVKNLDAKREYDRKYRERNLEKRRAADRERYRKNRLEICAQRRADYWKVKKRDRRSKGDVDADVDADV